MSVNIPQTDKKRVVIVGAGFGGLKVANSLLDANFQIVMIDRENYHQFQPLIYQVASSGLEPSSIAFPIRKDFQNARDFHFRLCSLLSVSPSDKHIETSIGVIPYDFLIIATGTTTNFYGMENVQRAALPMKSVSEAIALRNHILESFENATLEPDNESLRTIVIVGGGATGVEIAGALADMRKFIIGRDYPELRENKVRIILVEASPKVLGAMDPRSSDKALSVLEKMGVEIMLNNSVTDYIGGEVVLKNGTKIATQTLVWVSGVTCNKIVGLPDDLYGRGGRIKVDRMNRIEGLADIFVVGDAALQTEENYPAGHPQIAPVAVDQGRTVALNIKRIAQGLEPKPFAYKNKGNMATIGRAQAVVDMGDIHISGYFAWLAWLLVHLMSILGTKNKIQTAFNWFWNYITFDQSLRLIIRPADKKQKE